MTRDHKYGDITQTPAVRLAMYRLYRARVERDHAARMGTYREWQTAEARVRELTP